MMRNHFVWRTWLLRVPHRGIGRLAYHVLIAILIAPVLYLNCYAHPSPVDDYYNSVWTNYGEALRRVYLTNNGRYFSTAVTSLNPWHWHSIVGYRAANAGIIILYSWTFTAFVKELLRRMNGLPVAACRAIAVATFALLPNNMASHTEGFFWFTGAATYTLSLPLFFLQMILAMQLHNRVELTKKLSFLFLTVLVVGANEVMMTALGAAILGLLIFYKRSGGSSRSRFYSLALLLYALCAIIVLSSSGAWARHGGFHTSLIASFIAWPFEGTRLMLHWLSDPALLLYAAFTIILLGALPGSKPFLNPVRALMLPLAGVLALTAIPYFGIGTFPPPRVVNIVYALFLICLLPLLHCLAFLFRNILLSMPDGRRFLALQSLAIAMILGVGFSLQSHNLREWNYLLLARDILKRNPLFYDAGIRARYRRMQQPCDTCLVTLTPIPNEKGNLLSVGDVRPDTGATRNISYAHYWRKRAVRMAADK